MNPGDQVQVRYLRDQYNVALNIVFELDIQLDNFEVYNEHELQAMSIERTKIRAKMLYYDSKIQDIYETSKVNE